MAAAAAQPNRLLLPETKAAPGKVIFAHSCVTLTIKAQLLLFVWIVFLCLQLFFFPSCFVWFSFQLVSNFELTGVEQDTANIPSVAGITPSK